ncbi:PoNe immunity protein domain-containing protein [Herbaspirillum huttiense]|uniref:PoNe immunity protein domain-containing protein n=1 Tax=Herbaspirillum huttiense TaxID=863372 RepID=UPI0031D260F1
MIRDRLGDQNYWDKTTAQYQAQISRAWNNILTVPSANPVFEPEYVFHNAKNRVRYLLGLYSKGEDVRSLKTHFAGILDAWELSNKLAIELNKALMPGQGWSHTHLLAAPSISDDPCSHQDPRPWLFQLSNLEHYHWCFWLVALALLLEIADDQWLRLLALIGEEGSDVLHDRVIATRDPGRQLGSVLLHEKPYSRLLTAIDAPKGLQAASLFDFVEYWYVGLERKGGAEIWWYAFADPLKQPLAKGSYFGKWCLEAAVVAKVFDIDDSLCLGHESYPGDFLRPEGPSTHVKYKQKKQSFWSRFFPKSETKLSG